jgi:splicing factor 3A subunit 1
MAEAAVAPPATSSVDDIDDGPSEMPDGVEPDKKAEKKTIDTFTKAIGIIEPPPDLKLVVDRTADFVRRVGRAFEAEIIQRNAKSKKFGFLVSTSPYYAYYQNRIDNGPGPAAPGIGGPAAAATAGAPAPPTGAAAAATPAAPPANPAIIAAAPEIIKTVKTARKLTLKERLEAHIKVAKTPKTMLENRAAADKFTVKSPTLFTAQDIDIVKLTAQFVARNGRVFLSALSQREMNNVQFAFLKPTHTLFPFFQQLVDAYMAIIAPSSEMLLNLRKNIADPSRILEDIYGRVFYEKMLKDNAKKLTASEEQERDAMAAIDWHQFVVVETITFNSEDEPYLPAPKTSIEDINRMLSQQSLEEEASKAAADVDMDTGIDVDMDEGGDKDEDGDDKDGDKLVESTLSEPSDAPMPLRQGPEVSRRRAEEQRAMRFQKCNICGQEIPVEELSEHMRLELLDSKWKEQKQAMQEKGRESALASTQSMASNLARLARKRTDVFSSDDQEEKEEVPTGPAPVQSFGSWPQPITIKSNKPVAPPVPVPAKIPLIPAMPATPARLPGQSAILSAPPRAAQPLLSTPLTPVTPTPRPAAPPTTTTSVSFTRPTPAAPSHQIPANPFMPAVGDVRKASSAMADEPPAKKAKLGPVKVRLIPEDDFLAKNPATVTVKILIPQDAKNSSWNFNGQTIDLVVSLKDSVQALKEKLKPSLGTMPDKKMKLSFVSGSFLNKEEKSLAYYNVHSGAALNLGIKERAGRKKTGK